MKTRYIVFFMLVLMIVSFCSQALAATPEDIVMAFIKVEALYEAFMQSVVESDVKDLQQYSTALKRIESLAKYIEDNLYLLEDDPDYLIIYASFQVAAEKLILSIQNLRYAFEYGNKEYLDIAFKKLNEYRLALIIAIESLPKDNIASGQFYGTTKMGKEATVSISLQDKNGNPIYSYISKNDYRVEFENPSYKAEIIDVTSNPNLKNEMKIILFMIDNSGSLRHTDPDKKRVDAALGITQYLTGNDVLFISTFGNSKRPDFLTINASLPGNKTNEINKSINIYASRDSGEHTPLWVSMVEGASFLKTNIEEFSKIKGAEGIVFTPIIVVFTDGENNLDGNYSNNQIEKIYKTLNNPNVAIDFANYVNIPIYTIGLSSNVEYNTLNKIASKTNGLSGVTYTDDGLVDLFKHFAEASLKGNTLIKLRLNTPNAHGRFKLFIGDQGKYIQCSF